MKKLLVYTNWIAMTVACSAAEDLPPRPMLRHIMARTISVENLVVERIHEEERRRKVEEQLLEPNSPPTPPLPDFPAPVLLPIVLPTIIDMQPGSPHPAPRTPSPSSPRAPRRRLAVIPFSSYQPMTPPTDSPNSADMSPSPRPVTPEDPHARAVVQSVFLRIMGEDPNYQEQQSDEVPL